MLLCGTVSPMAAAAGALPSDPPSGPPSSSVGNAPTVSTSYSQVPFDFSLMISPIRLAVGPENIGKAQQILVVNRGQASASVIVQKRNFAAAADGSPIFQDDAPYSAAEWVTVEPPSFDVAPGETRTVTATITAPANPEPGDHQVVIVFLAPAGESDGNIKINRGIGLPILITAPGPIDDSVVLNDFNAPGFATGGPVTITATLQNTGTVHRDYRGTSPLLIDAPGTAVPFPDFTVTRGATRDVSTTWDPPLVGIFNPTVQFTNADGTVQTASVRVIVFPVVPAVIFVGALLVLGLLILLGRRGYRVSVAKAAAALQRPVSSGDG